MSPVWVPIGTRISAVQSATSRQAKVQALFPNLFQRRYAMGGRPLFEAFWETQTTKYIDTNPRASIAQRLYE